MLPVVDPELKSGSVKFKTYFESKLVIEGQSTSSPQSIPNPEKNGFSKKIPQSGEMTTILKNIDLLANFPYANMEIRIDSPSTKSFRDCSSKS